MIERIKTSRLYRKLATTEKNKLIKIIVAVGLIAMVGIFLSESFSTKNKQENQPQQQASESLHEYEQQVEQRLSDILSSIDGIGRCEVMVTLDSSKESVYSSESESKNESDEKSSSSSEKSTYVIVDDDGQKPVLEKEVEPRVRGVIVVCEGADDVYVRQAVVDSIRAGLGITSANISIVRGGKNG